jgi:predicted dehydrogenase
MNEMEPSEFGFNRRDFLKGSSLAAMMAMMGGVQLIPPSAAAADGGLVKVVKKVKVGLIGLGPWGREILDQLGRMEEADIAAICDTYPAMLRRSASKAPNAAQTEDYKTILANKDIPAIIVATGSHQHKDIVIAALKAGKHVYCEAPLAHTVEDAKAIALAAKDAVGQVFQAGLQLRADPQRHFLHPFLRSGALGKSVKARAQWHKKTSWRLASPSAEREKEINWRLSKATSPGLVGEIGIHAIEQVGWFLNVQPVAVTGFGSNIFWRDDGRDVADSAEVVIEYAGGFRMHFQASLATSFDSEYELLHGSDATVLMRDGKAWMFKEVDSPLLGWEVYAKKEQFGHESGIVLKVGGSKQDQLGDSTNNNAPQGPPPVIHALQAFLGNCASYDEAVADFKANFPTAAKSALAESLSGIEFLKTAGYQDGYAATVLALKANEAVVKGSRIELKKELFELA